MNLGYASIMLSYVGNLSIHRFGCGGGGSWNLSPEVQREDCTLNIEMKCCSFLANISHHPTHRLETTLQHCLPPFPQEKGQQRPSVHNICGLSTKVHHTLAASTWFELMWKVGWVLRSFSAQNFLPFYPSIKQIEPRQRLLKDNK
jgi:hypothetical protein